ncbi:hypothetical protein [Halorubrum distributum]|uniref:Uncharacterized protein n=1 Tax=Halorubrum distributum TaxID=29283 RepID=A0A6B1IGV5_9EURY|nr:hypothetical protein [Halorubrum terrestre]MYL68023.1 hypothetical protein [Halorubrum terrestre]
MDEKEKQKNRSEELEHDTPELTSNEEYLDERLSKLEEKYSYEELSDLSAFRLGAVDADREGLSEEDYLHREFEDIYQRFPDESDDEMMRRVWLGSDYKGLSPLTEEQKMRIRDCHHQCNRNLDKARKNALKNEAHDSRLSKFGSWLIDLADAATPIFGNTK